MMLLTTTVAMTIAILKHRVIDNMRLLLGGFMDCLQLNDMCFKVVGNQDLWGRNGGACCLSGGFLQSN